MLFSCFNVSLHAYAKCQLVLICGKQSYYYVSGNVLPWSKY